MKKQNIVDTGQMKWVKEEKRTSEKASQAVSLLSQRVHRPGPKISSLTRLFLYFMGFTNFILTLNSTNGYDSHSDK